MPAPYQLRIITKEKIVLDDQVESVIAPGTEGALGVWAFHAPLVTALGPGLVRLRQPDGTESAFHISGGFLEVRNNILTILADHLQEQKTNVTEESS